jgi:LmbE family N-acetylglucosaminyl deacetylase
MLFVQPVSVVAAAMLFNVVASGAVATPESSTPPKVLLGVLAHPDDETVCAGTLSRAAAAGWEVRVIYATSGDAGGDVSGRNLEGAALGKEREKEGAHALLALGVKHPPVYFRFGDGTLAQTQRQLVTRLLNELSVLKPDVILTFGPDGFTGHSDHIAVGRATDDAAQKVLPAAAVYHAALGRQLTGWAKVAGAAIPEGVGLPENLVTVDVRQFLKQRLASLDCHRTQWTPEVQARLRDFRREYPFEEYVWAGGGQGAPGVWVGP